ncbi:hypothetical protein BLA29_005942 [Euroglyphus maynei]|uniref:Uncharacterized protein n=1 Tax=Euroglyphus maynei TaxID=6958 RepID=A0A1Y3AP01_EURMA|nr:hypothetical protein BLA29_005942 [Euroglyphus maynei]
MYGKSLYKLLLLLWIIISLELNYSNTAHIHNDDGGHEFNDDIEHPSPSPSPTDMIPKTIVELNENNFQMMVMESSMTWSIVLYSSSFDSIDSSTISTFIANDNEQIIHDENARFWTIKMAIEFINESITMKGRIEFGSIDCDHNPQLRKLLSVESCPAILHFRSGQKQQNPLNREQPLLSMKSSIHSKYPLFNRVKKQK